MGWVGGASDSSDFRQRVPDSIHIDLEFEGRVPFFLCILSNVSAVRLQTSWLRSGYDALWQDNAPMIFQAGQKISTTEAFASGLISQVGAATRAVARDRSFLMAILP